MTDTTVVSSTEEYINVKIVEPYYEVHTTVDTILSANESISVVQVTEPTYVLVNTTSFNTPIVVGAQIPAPLSEDDTMYSKRVDFVTDNEMYKAEAAVGSVETSAVWRIRKILIGIDGDVTELWAEGNASFDKAWSSRASFNYS